MYKRLVDFNNGLFLTNSVDTLDLEVKELTEYVNSLDIKNTDVKYFQNNIIYLYDKYKNNIVQNAYDEILEQCGFGRVFNKKEVNVNFSKDTNTISITDKPQEQPEKLDMFISKVLDKINMYY